jgi:putative hydrolase of the HAD superfamily
VKSRTWLFDLDNVLHDANPHIFPHINRSMQEYIEQHLSLNSEEATALRQHYWERYGATLLGLVRHHQINPHHFLHATHQFDDLKSVVRHDPKLPWMLRKLVGRKIIFSNAPRAYALAVLDIIGIRHFFDAIYTVEALRFSPKPSMKAFRRLLGRERLRPQDCVFVEDTLANLKPAKKLGMKTVWVSARLRGSAHVDRKLRDTSGLLRIASWL